MKVDVRRLAETVIKLREAKGKKYPPNAAYTAEVLFNWRRPKYEGDPADLLAEILREALEEDEDVVNE